MQIKFLIPVLILISTALQGQTTLQLARNESLAEQYVAERVLSEIYRQLNLPLVVEPLPAARANALATGGQKDGEVARIESYGPKNPTMVRVEPAYYYLTTAAFAAKSKNITIRTKEDLLNYRVGIIRGVQHSMDATAGHPNVEVVSNAETLFNMLHAGRFDIALDTGINGAYMLKKLGLADIKEVGITAKLPLFNYLHQKNAPKAAVIGATIKKLQDSGELTRIVQREEQAFLTGNKAP